MKKHIKFVAYALAGFMAVSSINVPSVYAEEIPTETVIDTTNNSATDTTTETPTDSTADSSTETPADSTADSSSTSTNKTTTVKKATATKKQTVKIKKYKKSKKLYVKKATKAYKVTSTGKLKVAKSLKKSAKVTVVGTSTVKKIKYYAIKSGKSTMLVKQSLLSKTKPHSAKPSSNKPSTKPSSNSSSANKPLYSKHYEYNDKGQKVATQDNGKPSNSEWYAYDEFIRCNMPGVKPHHGDKCIGYKMVNGKKKNIYYNKSDNQCYYIDANGMECDVNHKNMWDGIFDRDDDGPGFE